MEEIDICQICCSKVNSSTKEVQAVTSNLQNENESRNNLLSKNLKVIFILRKLLQVPSFHLKCNLLEYGDPHKWISLCEECTQLTNQAFDFHQQIIKINHQLNLIKSSVIQKAKSSSLSQKQAENYFKDSTRKLFFTTTREFIENHDHTDSVNPFTEGDSKAEYLATKITDHTETNPDSPIQVKCEVEYSYPDNFEDDDLSSSSPPPPSTPPARLTKIERKLARKNESGFIEIEYPKYKRPCPKAPGNIFDCEICGKIYLYNSHLTHHKRTIHKLACKRYRPPKVAYYVCTICSKQIKTKEGLKHHINVTHGKKWRFYCHVCGKGWANKVSLKMHLLAMHKKDPTTIKMMEEGERIWKCGVEGCAIQFLKKTTLDKHTEKYHGGQDGGDGGERRFKCDKCEVSFHRRGDLKRHWIVHEKKKTKSKFSCDICGTGYDSQDYLDIHKQSFH